MNISKAQLRARFERIGDRYRHVIELLEPHGATKALLESIEGEAVDHWPHSPPLQQLHFEARPQGQVMLLVGMAGREHWSMSVEEHQADNSLVFDVACKCSRPNPILRSSYLLPANEEIVPLPIGRTAAKIGDIRIELLPVNGQECGELFFEEAQVLIRVSAANSTTTRWKYRLVVE